MDSEGTQISQDRAVTAQTPDPGNKEPGRKRRKVVRSRAGCLVCRKRRKACDMTKPQCGTCVRLKMDCCWPSGKPNEASRTAPPSDCSLYGLALASSETLPVPQASSSSVIGTVNRTGESSNAILHMDPPSTSTWYQAQYQNGLPQFGTSLSPVTATIPRVHDSQDLANTISTGFTPFVNFPESPYTAPAIDTSPQQMDSLFSGIDFSESMLQSWAANCLNVSSAQNIDPFQSLSDILGIENDLPISSGSAGPSRQRSLSPGNHGPLLHHYQRSLSGMVSCTGDSAPSAFAAFTQLANAQSTSKAGRGLHLSILAWAGRHMSNEGEIRYEATSDKLGEQASSIIFDRLEYYKKRNSTLEETERMTLLAGCLMLIQWKICRGDVVGFGPFMCHIKYLANSLYTPGSPGAAPDSMPFSFFENLLYHDVLYSKGYTHEPIIPYDIALSYSSRAMSGLNTLTGACLPVFLKMYRIARLTKQRREARAWDDESLIDIVAAADEIEVELRAEKIRMDELVQVNPSLASHRYLHEAFRTACLISLLTFVLQTPATSLRVRLLVRQSLSLLEQMYHQSLPGFCSAHWVMFVTAICCTKEKTDEEHLSDCERVERLYEDTIEELAFSNVTRSRNIVHEIWRRNQGGRVFVDWLDIIKEYDWELWLV